MWVHIYIYRVSQKVNTHVESRPGRLTGLDEGCDIEYEIMLGTRLTLNVLLFHINPIHKRQPQLKVQKETLLEKNYVFG